MGDLSAHFDRREFACRCGCGFDTVDVMLLEILEAIRQHYGMPVTISSSCRCSAHNARIKGSAKSQHLLGRAADFSVRGVAAAEVADLLERLYPGSLGIGRYPLFTHVDTRGTVARWSF